MVNILEAFKSVVAYALGVIEDLKAQNVSLVANRDQAIAEAVAGKEAELISTKEALVLANQTVDTLNFDIAAKDAVIVEKDAVIAQKEAVEAELLAEIESFKAVLNPPVIVPDPEPTPEPVPTPDPVVIVDPIVETPVDEPVIEPELPTTDPVAEVPAVEPIETPTEEPAPVIL